MCSNHVRFGTTVIALVAAAPFWLAPAGAVAQGRADPPPSPDQATATVAPGPRYEAGGVHRWLLGSDWRDLWTIPLTLPVLDIETFAGGLEPEEEGGNRQSITLHMEDSTGQGWIFRSLDKYPGEKLEVGGLVRWLVQDQVSSLHPAGQLLIPTLLDAVGILHVAPQLYVLPDDPALGQFRERFAGMVGALELQPNEDEGDTPGFAGSSKIVGSEAMLERLEDTPIHRVDQRELLRARLIDFIIGDTDRGTDQWRWARFEHPDHPDRYLWRPIPRDRDWSFISGDGIALHAFRTFYPKVVPYGPRHADVRANTFSSHFVDRMMLTELTREDVEAEVATIRRRLTDAVIEAAVDSLPEPYPASHRQRIAGFLKSRRDRLGEVALPFYAWLATEVDVRATDERDRAEIERRPDGTVLVTLTPVLEGGRAGKPYYRRVFRPDETREIRVFLHGDDDVATVRGSTRDIRVRVLGGGSDDLLIDSSGAGAVHLYDSRGDNRFLEVENTRTDTRDWESPPVPEGVRLGTDWAPDYGSKFTWRPVVDFGEYAGLIVGAGPRWTDYGFRRLPYHWTAGITPLYAAGANKFGVSASADYRFENSLSSVQLDARWVDFHAIRWFGLGNDTELVEEPLSLVPLDRAEIEPALVLRFGTWRNTAEEGENMADMVIEDETPPGLRASVAVGPVFSYTDAEPRPFSPFLIGDPVGSDPVWQVGARTALSVDRTDRGTAPRSGFQVDATARAFPGLDDDVGGAFGDAALLGRAYIPMFGDGPHLALRLGGAQAWGDFPAWHAPAIGGRASLRGFEFMRYAGEAAAFGGAEVRVPVGEVPLWVRGELGVFGLVDAARVWADGESPGGWHSGYGGGVWFSGAGQAVSLYFATGERDQIYLALGMPF